jgi:NitT/TauT family transport system permease protein
VLQAWWTWIFGDGTGAFEGTWASDAIATGIRVWIGFAIAAGLGISLGVLIGFSQLAAQLLDPVIQLLRPMPAVAWVPLAIVFFGFSPSATIFLIVYGAFFPIVLNTAAGVSRTPRSFVAVGRMLGATRWQMLRRILYPAALPSIFTGLRLGIGIAWILGIIGELIAVRSGLGYNLMQAYSVFRYDVIIAAMASFGLLGAASDWLVLRAEKRVLSWREGYDAEKS